MRVIWIGDLWLCSFQTHIHITYGLITIEHRRMHQRLDKAYERVEA